MPLNNFNIETKEDSAAKLAEAAGKPTKFYLFASEFNSIKIYLNSIKIEVNELITSIGNKVDKVTGKGLSTNDYDAIEKAQVASNTLAISNEVTNRTNADTALVTALKDGVAVEGDSLQKLYNLIIASGSNRSAATIAARNALNVKILDTVLVDDDGDGNWALYMARTAGVNATYIKISDPDLLNAVLSNAQIKTSYESNTDTNAFTNALKSKLDALPTASALTDSFALKVDKVTDKSLLSDSEITRLLGIATGATANSTDAQLRHRSTHTGTQLVATISDFVSAVASQIATALSGYATQSYVNAQGFITNVLTALGFTPLNPANNLSEVVSVATSRVNLELDKNTTFGNINYTILASDKTISTSVILTAPRTVTLIDGLTVGKEIIISDSFQAINGVNNIVIAVPTGKKLNGITNGTETIKAAGGWRRIKVEAGGDFSYDNGIARVTEVQAKAVATTGAVISFVNPQIYNTRSAPSAANITNDLTGATIGIIQKIFHNHSANPTFPATWIKKGTGSYVNSTLNEIYAEWESGTTVSYWIAQ